MEKPNRKRTNRCVSAIMHYLIIMIVSVVAIVLISYLAKQRNESIKLEHAEIQTYQLGGSVPTASAESGEQDLQSTVKAAK